MKTTMVITLLGILVVIMVLVPLFMSQSKELAIREDFDPSTDIQNAERADVKFTNAKAMRFNNVSDGMNDFLGGYLTNKYENPSTGAIDPTLIAQDQATANGLIQQTMNGVAMVGSTRTPSGLLPLGVRTTNTHLPYSSVQQKIKFCEELLGDGANVCEALNDPRYRECGVCLKDGTNSDNKRHVGGLFFSEYDKRSQDILQKDVDPLFRKLDPTIGKCNQRNFVTTFAKCQRRREQLLCEATGSFPRKIPGQANNCAQCVEQGMRFVFRGSKDKEFTAVLHLIAQGNVVISHRGINQVSNSSGPGLGYMRFVIDRTRENETINLTNTGNATQILAGQWTNQPATRTLPFFETIINKESVNINGTTSGLRISRDIPANQLRNFRTGTLSISGNKSQGRYDLRLNVSGFLAEPDFDEEAADCPTGAFLGTDQSMRLLKSNPCFTENPNAALGQACVAALFMAAGGNVFGKGYPSSQAKTDEVLKEVSRKLNNKAMASLTIDEIVEILAAKVDLANTGVSQNGEDVSIETINEASMFMLGIEVRSPCDINSQNGPLTDSCLQYLYDNRGAGQKEGPTYTSSFGPNTSFCTRKGTASPTNAQGVKNRSLIVQLRRYGGIRGVQGAFDSIHKLANSSGGDNQNEVQRGLAFCYGVIVPNQIPEQTSCESNIIAEYNITKKPVNSTQMMRMSLENTQDFGPMTDVDMILTRMSGTFTFNKNTILVNHRTPGNGCTIVVKCRQARAIQFWVRASNVQPIGNPYLMDLRSSIPDSYLWRPNDGPFWGRQQLFVNGNRQPQIPWPMLLDGSWHHIAINFDSQVTGDMFLFTRYSSTEGMDCEFGPVTIYKAPLTPNDVAVMFQSRPSWAVIPNIKGYQYKGCFRDSGDRALPFYQGNVSSREQCADRAQAAGMNTFALQYYGECWTGNHPNQNYARFGSAGSCPDFGGAWSQQVYYNPDIKPSVNRVMLQAQHSRQCISVFGGFTNNGAFTVQWNCNGTENFRMTYDPNRKTIKAANSNKCLTVLKAENHAFVEQYDCTGAWNQRWDFEPSGHIMLSGTNFAMDVAGGSPHEGARMIIWPKHNGGNQKFTKIA
jgi:hypothetical protein